MRVSQHQNAGSAETTTLGLMLLSCAQFRAFAYYSAKEKPFYLFFWSFFFSPQLAHSLLGNSSSSSSWRRGAVCIEKNRLQPETDKAPNLGQSGSRGNRAGETLTIRSQTRTTYILIPH